MREIPYRASVENLSGVPDFRNVVAAIQKLAPVVPQFDVDGQSNIEKIKYELARKAMHDLVMSILNPKGKAE